MLLETPKFVYSMSQSRSACIVRTLNGTVLQNGYGTERNGITVPGVNGVFNSTCICFSPINLLPILTHFLFSLCLLLNVSRKILGLLFCHFYPYDPTSALIRLYTSLVRPILEYCSIVWDPTSAALCLSLEYVHHCSQTFI